MRIKLLLLTILTLSFLSVTIAQNRVPYNGRQIFLSGSNIAWVNYAADLGPSDIDVATLEKFFSEFHENGGNVFRFWLHTDGSKTPVFDSNGFVTGPGPKALANLKKALDAAQKYDVGLQLCLWGFNMQNKTVDATIRGYNAKMLNDTLYTHAYINKALIPMVNSVKGHPALFAWEIFNEPEGMTNEFGWSSTDHVPMLSVQRFVNLLTGAIHRTDPTAKVTNGANRISTSSDVTLTAKISAESILNNMTEDQKHDIEDMIEAKYGFRVTAEEIINRSAKMAATFTNYYRDDRLVAAGGDSKGTLDFYEIHYYNDGSTTVSPFHHSADFWKLDKPLVVGEFWMNSAFDVSYKDFYKKLYETGYAGALSWQWLGDSEYNDGKKNLDHNRTMESTRYILENYYNDVVPFVKTGSLYFFNASAKSVEQSDSVVFKWAAETGSSVKINNESVPDKGSKTYKPTMTTTYTITTAGLSPHTKSLSVEYIPSGKFVYYRALPNELPLGDSTKLVWQASKGSKVTINGKSVPYSGTAMYLPTKTSASYKVLAKGETVDSNQTEIYFLNITPDKFNRGLAAVASASSFDNTIAGNKVDNMNDGNWFSNWISGPSDSQQWAKLDLGKKYNITSVAFSWGTNFPKLYTVELSDDDKTWNNVKSVTNNTGGTNTHNFISASGRYARISILTKSTKEEPAGWTLGEFEICGMPYTTGVEENNNELPISFALNQNYPNPFNPTTFINYTIATASQVSLKVFDMLGREVVTLVDEFKQPGVYNSTFSPGQGVKYTLSSGIYFYRLQAGNFTSTKKMVLIK